MAFPQLHHNVKEVHTVQLQLFSKRNLILQVRQIFIRRNILEDIQYLRSNLGGVHAVGSPLAFVINLLIKHRRRNTFYLPIRIS